MEFCIEIGGVAIKLCHQYDYIKNFCREYVTDIPAVFSVSVTDKQIEAERSLTDNKITKAICEATCLHREIVRGLVKYDIVLIHSAVIAVDGEAYVFLAKSGVGKSTHIRLWQEVFGERAVVVNGDKPMFSFSGDRLIVHGSPWKGKEGWGENISCPVKAFCLLERGEVNEIASASGSEIVEKIFHQVLLPKDKSDLSRFMAMMDRIIKETPFYRLRCNMEKKATLVAYESMRKDKR